MLPVSQLLSRIFSRWRLSVSSISPAGEPIGEDAPWVVGLARRW
jgi:hypothetical protein